MIKVSLKMYVIGFVTSLVLTLGAYFLVMLHLSTFHRIPTDVVATAILIGLALAQFIVQMLFFLHLGQESKPRWKLLVFFSMLVVVAILVFGSLWIMSSLNYRMTPQQIQNYMNSQDGL